MKSMHIRFISAFYPTQIPSHHSSFYRFLRILLISYNLFQNHPIIAPFLHIQPLKKIHPLNLFSLMHIRDNLKTNRIHQHNTINISHPKKIICSFSQTQNPNCLNINSSFLFHFSNSTFTHTFFFFHKSTRNFPSDNSSIVLIFYH